MVPNAEFSPASDGTAIFYPDEPVTFEFSEYTEIHTSEYPTYEGDYTVIPGDEPVTLPTALRNLTEDITIGAIPKNYGRITYDGSIIMVS